MPKTMDELATLAGRDLFAAWLARAKLTRAIWDSFADGMPDDVADGLLAAFPSLRPDDLPRSLHGQKGLLHIHNRRARVIDSQMTPEHRIAISKGHTAKSNRAAGLITEAGFTQTSLAEALGISQALLSQNLSGAKGTPQSRADRAQELTKGRLRATKANWPRLYDDAK
jgi:DNA-binding transcriptional regulator YdaS (Cro superfamily)